MQVNTDKMEDKVQEWPGKKFSAPCLTLLDNQRLPQKLEFGIAFLESKM